MSSIIELKLIGMDTSTLAGLAGDLYSSVPARKRDGEQFVAELSARGWLPVVMFESVKELVQHGNDRTVDNRISMFNKFSQVAHVDSVKYPGVPGTICDVLAREVRAFQSATTSDVLSIAMAVRADLFGYCDGRILARWLIEWVNILRPIIQDGHEREKHLSSISHIDIMGVSDKRVQDFRMDYRVDRDAIEHHHRSLEDEVNTLLRLRGVKGVDHGEFAKQFALDSASELTALLGPDGSCTFEDLKKRLLRDYGIDTNRLNDEMTVGEVAEMAGFNHKLKVASRALGLSQAVTVGDIPIDKCPSEMVRIGLDRCRRSAPRAQTGDLMDSHLASLACYCDLTIVDKRTREYLHQLQLKNETVKELMGRVESLSKYTDLLHLL